MRPVAEEDLRSAQGYTGSIEIVRGQVEHAGTQQIAGVKLGSACPVDSETDAVIPFELVVYNTTPNFSASPGVEVTATAENGALPQKIKAEMGYSSGPSCVSFIVGGYSGDENTNGPDTLVLSPDEPLHPHGMIVGSGFLIAPNYYSPAHPAGDPAMFRTVVLSFHPPSGSQYEVAHTKGLLSSQAISNALPLLPGSDGGCVLHQPCPPPFKVGNVP
jgi:hypothetical protein